MSNAQLREIRIRHIEHVPWLSDWHRNKIFTSSAHDDVGFLLELVEAQSKIIKNLEQDVKSLEGEISILEEKVDTLEETIERGCD